jgi:hypothetical protein
MFIDEGGEYDINSDHVAMWLDVKVKAIKQKGVPPKGRWDITDKTNWNKFEEVVAREVDQIRKEWEGSRQLEGGEWGTERIVKAINKGLWQAGMEVIGWKEVRGLVGALKTEDTREMKDARGGRKRAHKAWKRSLKLGEHPEVRYHNYRILQDWKSKVTNLEEGKGKQECQEFMIRVGGTGDHARGSSYFWRYWRSRVGCNRATDSLKVDGVEVTTPQGIKGALGAHFKGLNTPHVEGEGDMERLGVGVRGMDRGEGQALGDLLAEIKSSEVRTNIKNLSDGKASGVDRIPNEFLKRGGEALWDLLAKVFNIAIGEENIPAIWREAQVVLLHKGGETDNLDNYRGISVNSNMGKVFTKIMANRLGEDVESRGLLGEIQYGFRKGRSTEDAIYVLTQAIETQKRRGGRWP